MPTSISIFEAKTRFSQIIERFMLGEEFIITKHGNAVGKIVPENTITRDQLI